MTNGGEGGKTPSISIRRKPALGHRHLVNNNNNKKDFASTLNYSESQRSIFFPVSTATPLQTFQRRRGRRRPPLAPRFGPGVVCPGLRGPEEQGYAVAQTTK